VSAYVDAGQPGCFGVAANGEGPPAERGAVEDDPTGCHHDGEDDHQHRDADDLLAGDVDDDPHLHDLGPVVGHLGGQASGAHQHREGDDERHQPSVGDQQSVDQAGADPDQQRAGDHRGRAVVLGGDGGRPDRGKSHQSADREVDAAADDDERHAD
jgi:hypothetical protein